MYFWAWRAGRVAEFCGPAVAVAVETPVKPPFRTCWDPAALAWTALTGLVLLIRYPDWFARPRLWAEDGNVFFLYATDDWWADIFTPYSGYFHFLPRTIAWLGRRIDPAFTPRLYVYSAFAVTLCVVARVFSRRLSLPCKPLMALAIVGVPLTGEVFLCPTNIQWITALSLMLTLLMRDPEGAWDWGLDLLTLAVAGLTGPFCIFTLPFFIYRAFSRATLASSALAGVVLATALVQGWEVVFHAPLAHHVYGPFRAFDFAEVLSSRIPLSFLGSQAWAHSVSATAVFLLGMAGFALVSSSLLLKDRYRKDRIQLFLFAVLLVAFTAAKVREDLWDYRETVNADRYFYLPRVLMLWLGASCLDRWPRQRVVAASIGAAAVLSAVAAIPYVDGPLYVERHIERPYFEWSLYCDAIRRGDKVEIQTSPGWKFTLPDRLRR
jgi:hypothetical protein